MYLATSIRKELSFSFHIFGGLLVRQRRFKVSIKVCFVQVLGVEFLGLLSQSEEEGTEGEQWRVNETDGEGDYTNDVPLIGGGKGVLFGVVSAVNHDA